jgi:hypothetical protein
MLRYLREYKPVGTRHCALFTVMCDTFLNGERVDGRQFYTMMMKLKSITRDKVPSSFRDGREALQHGREEAAATDYVGHPRAKISVQVDVPMDVGPGNWSCNPWLGWLEHQPSCCERVRGRTNGAHLIGLRGAWPESRAPGALGSSEGGSREVDEGCGRCHPQPPGGATDSGVRRGDLL